MTECDDDVIRVASWNIEHNGISNSGDDVRWHLAMDILAELQPDVLLRQELTRAEMYGQRAVWAESRRLGGHIPFLAGATPESANPTGVYVDPDVFRPTKFFEHRTGMWHPVCNPVVQIDGAPSELSLASFHLCSFDPAMRATEAHRLAMLGKPGMAAIIGGDCNSYPHRPVDETVPLPAWSSTTDRSLFQSRTIVRDGKRVSDTVPDEILAGEHDGLPPVFVELGHYAATVLGQSTAAGHPDPLAPTSSLWRTDQGEMRRIDRIYATPQIAKTLIRLEVIVNDDVREASDHGIVQATFSGPGMRRELSPTALSDEGLVAA
ncbi:endonuclease/exonuclease/phosphatase family protein [Streptomyces prunicolor]|uniref:endonuclease/exonuclease/phosphatase family protein n=1 Tax=Streptomyces prunicolor TaxID=67348 RepID=UPI0037112FFF